MKLPRLMFLRYFNSEHPLFLFDIYSHTMTFVTIKEPRQEKGFTIAAVIFKYRISLSFYWEKPYVIKSKLYKKIREGWYGKEKA